MSESPPSSSHVSELCRLGSHASVVRVSQLAVMVYGVGSGIALAVLAHVTRVPAH